MTHRLSTDVRGDVLTPGDDGYAAASETVFASGAPALVVRAADPDDVLAAIRYATSEGLALSVRSGGHSALGHGTNTGGLVLDLSRLDSVVLVDPGERIVRVGGGATLGKVAADLAPHGLGLTAGDTTSVGVGGLTVGGGVGWMVRKHGLAIDSLVAARVVTADGRVLVASETENADLFWAIRGGGGNFGVVVEFDFVTQPIGTVHFGTVTYALDDPAGLVGGWRDHMRVAPEELTSTLTLMPPMFGMPASAMVSLCYAGDGPEATDAVEPLLRLGAVTQNDVSERPYADILEDAGHPPGIRVIGRNTLLATLDDDAVTAIAETCQHERPLVLSLRSLGGAFGRVPAHATAFAHREAEAMVIGGAIVAGDAPESAAEEAIAPWSRVAELGIGLYVNFQGSDTTDDLAAAYPPATYARLLDAKRAYDPGNVFARNHNVAPAGATVTAGPAA